MNDMDKGARDFLFGILLHYLVEPVYLRQPSGMLVPSLSYPYKHSCLKMAS
jgi:hypothetical protein